jgi:hypothetical protein
MKARFTQVGQAFYQESIIIRQGSLTHNNDLKRRVDSSVVDFSRWES